MLPSPAVASGRGNRIRWSPTREALAFYLLAAAAVIVLVGSPVFGWFRVVRVSAVLWFLLLGACLTARPWRWPPARRARAASWMLSTATLARGTLALGLLLLWLVYSRFQAGGIDAVDFTVYFDRPLYQTSQGRLFFVESTDDPRFEQLTHLAVHGYWILLPLAALYWIQPSPLWLLVLSVVAITAGAVHIYRALRTYGAPGIVATSAAAAFALNGNTARALNYGFHAEILYAWFVPWAIDAGLRRSRGTFLIAVVASVLVKEDAIFPLLGVSVALALTGPSMNRPERITFLVMPTALALVNLAAFYTWIVPALAPDRAVMYAYFWASSGETPWAALVGLLSDPVRLLQGAIGCGFFTLVLSRHWYLPLLGWRWVVGLLPVVFVYGASDNPQVRGFGIYYAIPFVPLLAIATAVGATTLSRRIVRGPTAELMAAALVLASALSIGLGYSLRPWKDEIRSVRQVVAKLESYDRILVQGGLYPHAGYDRRVQLLTPHDLAADPAKRTALLLAPRGSTYPLTKKQWQCLLSLVATAPPPAGLFIVDATVDAQRCVSPEGT